MEDILKWLSEPSDYSIGIQLAERHIRNRNLVKYFSRRKDVAKLMYELRKVAVVKPVTTQVVAVNEIRIRIEYDTLPDELKHYYDKAAQSYQEARKNHYAMKAARSDEDRKKFRDMTLESITESRKCWDVIDLWKSSGELPLPVKSPDKSIPALATSLTRDMAKLAKLTDEAEISEAKRRLTETVTELHKGGRVFSPKTMEKLKQYNIVVPDAKITDN